MILYNTPGNDHKSPILLTVFAGRKGNQLVAVGRCDASVIKGDPLAVVNKVSITGFVGSVDKMMICKSGSLGCGGGKYREYFIGMTLIQCVKIDIAMIFPETFVTVL